MNDQVPESPSVIFECRRTIAFLLLARDLGCDVKSEFAQDPNLPGHKLTALNLRATIRAKYASATDTHFQKRLEAQLNELDTKGLNDNARELHEWMIQHIDFRVLDDPLFAQKWQASLSAKQGGAS